MRQSKGQSADDDGDREEGALTQEAEEHATKEQLFTNRGRHRSHQQGQQEQPDAMRTLNENQPAVTWYQMPAIEDDGGKRRHQGDSQIPGNQEERRQAKVPGR